MIQGREQLPEWIYIKCTDFNVNITRVQEKLSLSIMYSSWVGQDIRLFEIQAHRDAFYVVFFCFIACFAKTSIFYTQGGWLNDDNQENIAWDLAVLL